MKKFKLILKEPISLSDFAYLSCDNLERLTDHKLIFTGKSIAYKKFMTELKRKKLIVIDLEILERPLEEIYMDLYKDYTYETD